MSKTAADNLSVPGAEMGVNTEKARHQISPIPPLVYVAGAAAFLLAPLWMMFVGGLFTGFHAQSVGVWIGGGLYLFMIVFGFIFRVILTTPLRFHEGPPAQDLRVDAAIRSAEATETNASAT